MSDLTDLGLGRPITRRDFVYGSSVALGGAFAGCAGEGSQPSNATTDYKFDVDGAWYGPGGVGDYAASHGNTPGVLKDAHEIRAGRFDQLPASAIDSNETYDLVIVGGGLAGLSAAHHFRRLNPAGRALLLDNHPIFGGEAKRNDFDVNGVRISAPQGSNDFGVLPASGDPDDYFTSLGIPREFQYVNPGGAASGLRIPNDNYGFLHWQHDLFDVGHFFNESGGSWVKDFWRSGLASAPLTVNVQNAFRRARGIDARQQAQGEIGPWLDSMTMKAYYEGVLGLPPEFTSYIDPILASIIGLGCDAISAWWGFHFELPGFRNPDRYKDITFHCFPGGNAGIARYFAKNIVPDCIEGSHSFEDVLFAPLSFDRLDRDGSPVRMRLGSTVVQVEHEGARSEAERVRVTYMHQGQAYHVQARAVVMASGGWINRYVVKDLPDAHRRAYETMGHSAVLVANVALTNWRFLERLGISSAIWSGGFGFSCNIRRPMIVGSRAQPLHPDEPIAMTFYVPIYQPGLPAHEQGVTGRVQLLSTSFADYEQQIREQMTMMFSSGGFDAATDIAGIILNRWGHAYTTPAPGFMFGANGNPAPPDVIREPIGRIAIGHSELRGHQNWTGAAGEGRRAVESLLDRGL